MSTPEFANTLAASGAGISANHGLDHDRLPDPISKLFARLLTDPSVTFRFDASDLMPAQVGAGTFWVGMTDWINGADSATVLHRIEKSWPRA